MPYINPQAQAALSPQVNNQRNSIVQAMMNIQRPPPPVMGQLPQGRQMMGLPQMRPPGAPPLGAPSPQMPAPTMALSGGVPPQQPPMQPGMMPQGAQAPMPAPQMQNAPPGYPT